MTEKQEISATVVLHNKAKLFVAKRANTKKFMPSIYELPGGRIDFGEEVEDGLLREIKEEFHIDVIIERPFHAFTYIREKVHTVEIIYFARLKNKSQKIRLNPEDHSEYAWITQAQLKEYLIRNPQELKVATIGFKHLNDKSSTNTT
jgi:mutator protein MutT